MFTTLLLQLFYDRAPLIPPAFRIRTSRNATSQPHLSTSSPRATSSPSGSSPLTDSLNATRKGSQSADSNASLKKLLCVQFQGRIGNNMFQYASTLGLALTSNRTPVFLGGNELTPRLKHPPDPAKQRILTARCQKASFKMEESAASAKYDSKLTRLDPDRDFRIGNYLQSYRYFEGHEAEIRKALVFSDKIRDTSSAVVRGLRKKYNSSTLIGVHIRRGDKATEGLRSQGYVVPSTSFVNRSLTFFQKLYPRCAFVVASDSPEWCQNNFPGEFRVEHLPRRDSAVDMSIIAAMDHTITSVGTFSWWVGFLNPGKTVYMKDFIVPGSVMSTKYMPGGKDHIYPGWIPL